MEPLKVQIETITKFFIQISHNRRWLENFVLENHQKIPKIRVDTETLERILAWKFEVRSTRSGGVISLHLSIHKI